MTFIPYLPEGTYCHGRVERMGSALLLNIEGKEKQVGVVQASNSRYYAGHFKNGQKHGFGVLKLSSREIFEGDFVDNQTHGWGVQRKDGKVVQEGIYVNNAYQGNPNCAPKPKRNSFLDFLQGK